MKRTQSDWLEKFAADLLQKLKYARKMLIATPTSPMFASTICADYNKTFAADIEAGRKRKITTVQVRAAVSYLCGKLNEPVASTSGKSPGYFYALNAAEFERATVHIMKRIAKMSAHYHGPLKRFEREATGELEFGKTGN